MGCQGNESKASVKAVQIIATIAIAQRGRVEPTRSMGNR